MAISHPTSVRTSIADHVVDKVDAGSTDAQADLVLSDGGTTLVTINLNDPAFGAASSGTASIDTSGGLTGTATATGTADSFVVQDKDNSAVISGSVATTGSDINLSSVNISSGDRIQVSTLDYNAPS